LRPLRFVARYKNMRVVVNSLLGVFGPLLNVGLVMMLVWLIFAILGMNFLGGKMNYCDIDDPYNVSQQDCLRDGHSWRRAFWNFDNIGESFVTLFVLVSMEAWPNLMATAMDVGDVDNGGPQYNGNMWIALYYLLILLIGGMFLMDLFIGVIFYQYGLELETEISMTCTDCTEEQVKWVMIQKLIYNSNSNFALIEQPKNRLRAIFFKIINSTWFEIFILLMVVVNMMILGMEFEGMNEEYEETLKNLSDIITWIFVGEFVFKFIALWTGYFKDSWNSLDFAIVAISLIQFFFDTAGLSSTRVLKEGPQIARALRIVRLLRVVRLLKTKHLHAFNELFNTLLFSLPTIGNIFALLLLVYFIFSVVGCFIFKNAQVKPEYDSDVLSFKNFHIGFLTLFRLSTGEDWPSVMYNYGESPGNYIVSRIYFLIFVLVVTFIMLNLFELVIVQIFDSFYFDPDNVLAGFEKISYEFNKTWNAFTVSSQGEKIKYINLPRFFAHLE
jgi:hypothetical protein